MISPIDAQEIRLLTEVGFLAAARADVRRAEAIFNGLKLVRPAGPFCFVGLAMAYLNANRADDAVRELDRGLLSMASGDKGQLEAFRGLALQLAGRSNESVKALRRSGTALGDALLGTRKPVVENCNEP